MGILLTTSPSSLSVSTGGPPDFEPSCCTDWSNNVSLLKPLPIHVHGEASTEDDSPDQEIGLPETSAYPPQENFHLLI